MECKLFWVNVSNFYVTYDIRGAFALKNHVTLVKYKKAMEEKLWFYVIF